MEQQAISGQGTRVALNFHQLLRQNIQTWPFVFSIFVQTSTSMIEPWNSDPLRVAIAFCTSSALVKEALPAPLLPIFTNLQVPACDICSCNALLRSVLASFCGKPPIHAVVSGSAFGRLPLPLPLPASLPQPLPASLPHPFDTGAYG